jgi:hypothetical protein
MKEFTILLESELTLEEIQEKLKNIGNVARIGFGDNFRTYEDITKGDIINVAENYGFPELSEEQLNKVYEQFDYDYGDYNDYIHEIIRDVTGFEPSDNDEEDED